MPFNIYCSHINTNFFSFDYVLHKFFELLVLNEFFICIQRAG